MFGFSKKRKMDANDGLNIALNAAVICYKAAPRLTSGEFVLPHPSQISSVLDSFTKSEGFSLDQDSQMILASWVKRFLLEDNFIASVTPRALAGGYTPSAEDMETIRKLAPEAFL
jgi:hypothetical protein